jgi:hypothetical protein
MDKLDIFLFFPLALLLQMSMVFTALFLCFGKALNRLYTSLIDLTLLFALCAESHRTLLCSFYLFLRLILFLLYWTHCFANTFLRGLMIVCNALMFWPRFYNNLFGAQSTGRSFLTILFDPEGGGLSNWPCLWNAISQANCICPIWSKFNVFSSYQVHGVYAHLHQSSGDNMPLAIEEASGPPLRQVWDPLCLATPYQWITQALFKPPDCCLACLATIALLVVAYSVPLARGALHLTHLHLQRALVIPDRQFLSHTCKISHRVYAFVSSDPSPCTTSMTFESDGIPFIIDDSATCIISNIRLLFVGNMKPETIHIETVHRDGTGTRYRGNICLNLTDDANIMHTYDVPNSIYDPYTNFNILGVPFLGNFFRDQAMGQDAFVKADGT